MEKWYSIELEKKYNDLFEKGLKLNNVYFEKSCINDNLFHYELCMSEYKVNAINDLLDLIYHLEG